MLRIVMARGSSPGGCEGISGGGNKQGNSRVMQAEGRGRQLRGGILDLLDLGAIQQPAF